MQKTTLYISFFLLTTLSFACAPTSSKGEWIPEDKQRFMTFCKEAKKDKNVEMSPRQISAVCNCALKKSIQVYESFYAANADSIKLVGDSCIEKIK